MGIPLFLKIGNIFNQSLAFLAMVDNVAITSTIALYMVETEPMEKHGPYGSKLNLLHGVSD